MNKASLQESEPGGAGGFGNFDQQRIYPGLMGNDQMAWAEFYDYFSSRLDKYFECRNVYLERDREELLQETMRVIFTALDTYDPTLSPLKNWVYGVAWKVMTRQQERVYLPQYENELSNPDALDAMPTTYGGLAEGIGNEVDTRITHLRVALSTLSVSDQQILKLRSERDEHLVTFTDIGQELGIPPGTARMRYKRARDRLHEAYVRIVKSSSS